MNDDDNSTPTRDRPSRWRNWKVWVGILAALLVLGALTGDPDAADPAAVTTPTPEPSPTRTVDTTPPSPAKPTRQMAVNDALGKSNRGITTKATVTYAEAENELWVTWAIDDNLTDGMIKRGARTDAVDILEALVAYGLDDWNAIVLDGTFSMVDQLGNASEKRVVLATYPLETVKRINFANFLSDNVWAIGDNVFVHPAFRD